MQESRIFGGIFGLVIGDVLGVPVEFSPRSSLDSHPVTDLREYGTHHQPKGTWSDDTSLTLCLLDSLCSGFNISDIGSKFLLWYKDALWTSGGKVFDIGIGTREAILRIQKTGNSLEAGNKEENSNGNGSLMRILPLAYYTLREDIDSRREKCFQVSQITHAHIRSQLACWLYVEIVCNLLNDQSKEEAIQSGFDRVEKWALLNHFGEEWALFSRCNLSIQNDSRDSIRSSGYVLHSLEAAIWCFLNGSDFEKSVLMAVNLGDDTDTVGAITGGLCGTYYGLESIRKDWLNAILKKKEIEILLKKFISICKK